MPGNDDQNPYEFFQNRKPKILITGANGFIGRVVADGLHEKFSLILVDYHAGPDRFNRFGLEQVEPTLLPTKMDSIIAIDLAIQKEKFDKVLEDHKPDCVLHFAGILENQDVYKIKSNNAINRNVLEVCARRKIPVVFASSIMVMYGAAIADDKVRLLFEGKPVKLSADEYHSVHTPLKSTAETIKRFNQDAFEQNFTYIKTKEFVEELAQALVAKSAELTMVGVRIGWAGIKNPYLIEGESKPHYTEIPVYLDKIDLKNFMLKLVDAILSSKIHGYKCYPCVSIHPLCWVNQEDAQRELQWSPEVDIQKKYGPKIVAKEMGIRACL